MTIHESIETQLGESFVDINNHLSQLQIKGRMDDATRDKILIALIKQCQEYDKLFNIQSKPKRKDGKVPLFNPSDTYTVRYDVSGKGIPEEFTIHAGEVEYFETAVAEHIKKHLANEIVNKRGVKTNYTDEFNAVLKEITIEL